MEKIKEGIDVDAGHLKEELDLYMGTFQEGGGPVFEYRDKMGRPAIRWNVNIPHAELAKNEIAVKNYSENGGMLKHLVEKGFVSEPKRHVQSGHVKIPVCELEADFYESQENAA